MMQTILAFFGYVRVPLTAVQLSMIQEEFLKSVLKHCKTEKNKEQISILLEGQKTLTSFLRSGRLLS